MHGGDRSRMIVRGFDERCQRTRAQGLCGDEDAAWQFLRTLVLAGLIRPQSEEMKKILLAGAPPIEPKGF